MSLPFRLSNIHNGDAIDIKRNPAVRAPEDAAAAPAAAAQAPAEPVQSAASTVHVMSDAERMQQLAALQEQERLAAARIEEENRLAAKRAREEQDRRMAEAEAQRKENEEIARRLREKEARMMKQWSMDDDSLMAQVAQQMSTELHTEMKDDDSMPAAAAPAAATAASEPAPPPEKPFDINNVSVYKPNEGASQSMQVAEDLPDDFYELTVDDLRAIREAEKESKENSGVLMTREMRERQRQKKWAAFTTCSLRVRFPDRVELMNVFSASSRVSDLYDFVRQCMADPETPFELYTTPPLTVLSNMTATFINSRLVPAAIVHLRWTGAKKPATNEALKPDLLSKIQSGVPQASSSSSESASSAAKQSSSSTPKLVCSVCLSSASKLYHCLECDNNYCSSCWNTVHDPSENPELGHHHKGEVRPPSSLPPSASQPERQHPRSSNVAGGDNVAASKSHMPKWFMLGKKY